MRIVAFDKNENFLDGSIFEGEVSPDVISRALETFHREGDFDDMDPDIQNLAPDLYQALEIAYPAAWSFGDEDPGDWVFDEGSRPWQRCHECYGLVVANLHGEDNESDRWVFIPTWTPLDHRATVAFVQSLAEGAPKLQ